MKNLIAFSLFLLSIGTNAQQIGGSCEGCEAIFEFGSKKLSWIDTLPDFKESGPKLEISGIIYQKDGKTPAEDVILYIYHTDQKGVYPQKGNETGWGKRHGYLRGWIKTNADGKYKFYTLRPASYPDTRAPQHIHPVIKEPNKNEYYIDEYLFTDDPFLNAKERAQQQKRGGSGILTLSKKKDGTWVGKRDIILGLNIPTY
jgi:protocatechuate 3,4-dioxygenase, beta subunit